MSEDIHIQRSASHRNGICGQGFEVVLFTEKQEGVVHQFVAIRFPANESGLVPTAVLDVDLLHGGVIEFGLNSWRGDQYECQLRDAGVGEVGA